MMLRPLLVFLGVLDPYGRPAVGMNSPKHYESVARRYVDAWHAMSDQDIEDDPERANHYLTQARVYRNLTTMATLDHDNLSLLGADEIL